MLLTNHLKALKLPTLAREHEKVAFEAGQDRAEYPRYLLHIQSGNRPPTGPHPRPLHDNDA
ncbi:hypothetical protein FHW96_003857 [Novosphingobium sp. SG751A]|uniref:hypothetical protein n=1 Tax=Novosphingobium sp. SG751A TaxID=2587000 RepID=UPI001C12C7E2|nr:hypothetical protein [Novosphingobium sp. SG751A]NOW47675.1 hypothetical protein [Novosphingobium sp. SG751A]